MLLRQYLPPQKIYSLNILFLSVCLCTGDHTVVDWHTGAITIHRSSSIWQLWIAKKWSIAGSVACAVMNVVHKVQQWNWPRTQTPSRLRRGGGHFLPIFYTIEWLTPMSTSRNFWTEVVPMMTQCHLSWHHITWLFVNQWTYSASCGCCSSGLWYNETVQFIILFVVHWTYYTDWNWFCNHLVYTSYVNNSKASFAVMTLGNCRQCLQCFDAVGWASGRASGL